MLGRCSLQRLGRHPPRIPWIKPPSRPNNIRHLSQSHRSRPQSVRQCQSPLVQRNPFQRPRSRTLFTSTIPKILVPPAIFVGLLLGLWAWKCFWIIVMQDKLLYISWLPPFARSETIENYVAECKPVQWEEKQIRSLDGTKLAVCEGRIPMSPTAGLPADTGNVRKSVVVCYFQGNGGSTPMRLPLLSQILRSIRDDPMASQDVEYTIVALSYRGYWTSSGRATQSGIELDAQAFLEWVSRTYSAPDKDLEIVLWGHSLGSAVASTALSTCLSRPRGEKPSLPITGLVMEAPTSSIKDMLISLYPQKWLPYRYLWPFSWNNWNSTVALERMAHWRDQDKISTPEGDAALPARSVPPIFILSAQNDEVIPSYVAGDLHQTGSKLGLDIAWKEIPDAMHIEAPVKPDGKKALVEFIIRCTSKNDSSLK